jgi:hypothetical protein
MLLFGTVTQPLGEYAPRILKSKDESHVTHYIKEEYYLLIAHNVFNRAEQSTLPGNRHAFAERIDRNVVAASLSSEHKMKRIGIRRGLSRWQRHERKSPCFQNCLTMTRTRLDHTAQLQQDVSEFNEDSGETFVLPTTIH